MIRKKQFFIGALLCTVALWAVGCAGPGSYGMFTPDSSAKTFFETHQILPQYTYYITGSDTYPVALLALEKSYRMGNDLWKPVDLTEASMKQLIINMQTQLMSCCMQDQSGFIVYDQKGKKIGLLYSFMGVGLSFRVDEQGTVYIGGPRDDDQLKNYQGRTPSPQ